jgi:hypothetical protein
VHRNQVAELFYITHVANVAGILRSGILSHNRVAHVTHRRVDLETVQERRSWVRVSDTRMLHDHACLYICGRNAMMYHVVQNNPIDTVCLLRVSPDVLDLPAVVVTDGNAASGVTRFDDVAAGIAALDFARVHAQSWIHTDDLAATGEHRRVKQAEVLVPDYVDPTYILGALAPTSDAKAAIEAALGARSRGVVVARYPFFDGYGWHR